MDTKTPMTLAQIRAAIKANLGTPQNNANAAKALAGTTFIAENAKGEFVIGTVLAELSPKGKVQAELACCVEDCNEKHTREQSDWHQSVRCRIHAESKKAKLTDEEKKVRSLERAKAMVAKLSAELAPAPVEA